MKWRVNAFGNIIKNISGPSTVPCGTPDKTGTELEDSLSDMTHWEQ